MPYEYFDRYVFECWATYGTGVLRRYQSKKLDDEGRVRWSAHDEEDHRIYAFEVHDPRSHERRAWTFVIERDGALEVEELYVRREYRRLGHGRWLADRVAELARKKQMPLRLWVAFADCKSESESNYSALVSTARRLGVQFQACPVLWAAYFATTEQPGEVFPVEPIAIPDRPRAPRDAVRAFVMALSLGQGEAGPSAVPPASPIHASVVPQPPAGETHYVSYTFLRGLELEGRHPYDVGGWHVTIKRMEAGEGVPLETDPAFMVKCQLGEPYPPAPKLHASRLVQCFYYRRMRSSAEIERHILTVEPQVPICLYLFASWAKPPIDDVIPMPSESDRPLPDTHLVVLRQCLPDRRMFLFRNTWGDNWGAKGIAALSYDYVDKYVFESWVTYLQSQVSLESNRREITGGRQERRWVVRDEQYRRIYGFEVWDEAGKERQGWSFVVEDNGGRLEVEEFYVRPEFRGRGLGRTLAAKVRAMADAKRMPLFVFVPFADCKQENESNYQPLVATARRLRVTFQPCAVPWAAYFATDAESGSETPVEPLRIPPRPRSTLEAVLAAASMLTGPGDVPPPVPSQQVVAAALPTDPETIDIDSKEWEQLIRRRGALISKKNREGLNDEERIEYEQLEKIVDATMERRFPSRTGWDEKIAAIESHLWGGSDPK
jgi:GNAT superfamily N-acetyltransferase